MIKNGAGTAGCSSSGVLGAFLGVWWALGVAGCSRPELPPGYQGVVEYDERALAFEVSGRVVELNAREGDRVEPGQVLARLDGSLQRQMVESRKLEAEAQQAQLALVKAGSRAEEIRSMSARVDAARATEQLLTRNVARERKLVDGGASTGARLDELEANLERARAETRALEQQLAGLRRGPRSQELELASHRAEAAGAMQDLEEERLERHQLHTPVTGAVLDLNVEIGEVIQAGAPALVVADETRPYAEVFVPQDSLAGIRRGTRAKLRVDSLDQAFDGEVSRVARRTEFTPRYLFSEGERHNLVVRVRVDVQDPEGRLHAGVPAFVELEAEP